MESILLYFSFFFGAIVGSFLNVLIYRLPNEMNIALPASHCPSCKNALSWYHNIPIFSYLFLRGRCSKCSTRIPLMYPLVELISAICSALLAPASLDPIELVKFFFLFTIFCSFLVHLIVDIKHQILPDSLNIYLGLIFFTVSAYQNNWSFWFSGGAIGLLFPLTVSWIFYKIRGEVGLGGGDIKLYGVLGLYLGPLGIMQTIFLSCLVGAVIGSLLIAIKAIQKEKPIAFGPFIILVSTIQIFFPQQFSQLIAYIP